MNLSGTAQIVPNPIFPEHYYDYITERPVWAGFWFNVYNTYRDFTGYTDVMAGETDKPTWAQMEPSNGQYNFTQIRNRLKRAKDMDTYYYAEMWLGSHSPAWIYDAGVTKLTLDEGTRPDFFDPDFSTFSHRFFNALADSIASWDQSLIDRIAFIQPGFGSTGDRQLYKSLTVTNDQYISFMKSQSIAFTSAFQKHTITTRIRFLWNISPYEGETPSTNQEDLYGLWMKESFNCQLVKQQFLLAVGYQIPNEKSLDARRNNYFGLGTNWGGNPEFVRGEFNDDNFNNAPLAKINQELNYYWTALASVHKGLDAWEGKYTHIQSVFKKSYAFSNKYSYYKRPATSPYAYIALRDGLDFNNIDRFPTATYGSTNTARVTSILTQFAPYGARNDDNASALNLISSDYLSNATGFNDCTKDILETNFSRFITQIDANTTTAGYWRVGLTGAGVGQPYGRFARGFDVAKGKNAMYFDVDNAYYSGNNGSLIVKVTYYSKEAGSWALKYRATDGTLKTAYSVTNNTSLEWVTKEVTITDALLDNGGPLGADLVIENVGGTNCKFHLIELERTVPVAVPVEMYNLINRSTLKKIKPVGSNSGDAIKQASKSDNTNWTKWIKVNDTEEFFYLKNAETGMYLRPLNTNNNVTMEQSTVQDDLSLWKFQTTTSPYGYLINKNTTYKFKPQSSADGANIIAQTGIGLDKEWNLEHISSEKHNQTIFFSALPVKEVGNADFAPGATASSGLTVTYTSSNTDVATIVGSDIHIVGAGTSVITASQAGNVTFNAAANATQTLTVNKLNQTISFPALPAKEVGNADFAAGATASSGLTVTYTSSNTDVATIVGSDIHIVGAGTSVITASQTGNVTYNAAANATQTLTVTLPKYNLINRSTLKKIKPVGSNSGDDVKQASESDNTDWTKWIKVEDTGGFFYLKNAETGMYLRPLNTNNNVVMEQSTVQDDLSLWKFQTTVSPYGYLLNKNTTYKFRPQSSADAANIIAQAGTTLDKEWNLELVTTLQQSKEMTTSALHLNGNIEKIDVKLIRKGLLEVSSTFNIDKILVYNLSGILLLQQHYQFEKSVNVNIENLKSGIYIIHIYSNQNQKTEKIIVR